MTATEETLLGFLRGATSFEAFQLAAEKVRDHFGVLHTAYHWVNAKGERFEAGTYSTSWIRHYLEKDYLRTDPVVFGCFQRFSPANWKELDWTSKPAQAIWRDARAFGIGNQGYSVPVRGPAGQFALFTLNAESDDETWQDFIDANAWTVMIFAHEFNRKALELGHGADAVAAPCLSPRELAAMRCLAQGMSRAQAAADMRISEHTLRVYIESARHKLGAANTTHAVARALSAGLIIV